MPETVPPVTLSQVKDSWPEILEAVQKAKRTAWMVVFTAKPLEFRDGNVLVLSFPSQNDVDALKQRAAPGEGIGDVLKQAVFDVLGVRPGLLARVEAARADASKAPPAYAPTSDKPAPTSDKPAPTSDKSYTPTTDDVPPEQTEPDVEPPVPPVPSGATWATAVITDAEPETKRAPDPVTVKVEKPVGRPAETPAPAKRPAPVATADGKQRYGESVVREILGASFIEEQTVAPRVAPREQ